MRTTPAALRKAVNAAVFSIDCVQAICLYRGFFLRAGIFTEYGFYSDTSIVDYSHLTSICLSLEDDEGGASFLHRADQNLLRAKAEGRNQVVCEGDQVRLDSIC